MAHSVSSMELWLRAQLIGKPWESDFTCLPMPWNEGEARRATGKLVVAVLWDDGVVRPTPPVTVSRHNDLFLETC